MLTTEQKTFYAENGFLVIENVVPEADLRQACAAVERFVEQSRAVTQHLVVTSPPAPLLASRLGSLGEGRVATRDSPSPPNAVRAQGEGVRG